MEPNPNKLKDPLLRSKLKPNDNSPHTAQNLKQTQMILS